MLHAQVVMTHIAFVIVSNPCMQGRYNAILHVQKIAIYRIYLVKRHGYYQPSTMQLLFKGSYYLRAAFSALSIIHAATTQTYFKFEEVPGLLCHNVYTLKRRCTQDLHITRETQIIAVAFIQGQCLCLQMQHSLWLLFKRGDQLRCGV